MCNARLIKLSLEVNPTRKLSLKTSLKTKGTHVHAVWSPSTVVLASPRGGGGEAVYSQPSWGKIASCCSSLAGVQFYFIHFWSKNHILKKPRHPSV